MQSQVLDVLIIGAGVSGITMACALVTHCPDKRFEILERRVRLGGTWDLFRFPGVRSDSDMHSYAFSFRPWRSDRVLGEGSAILDYLDDTVREFGVAHAIRYRVRVSEISWSSVTQTWTVRASVGESGEQRLWYCRFLVMGTGYYDHDAGYQPKLPGLEQFTGTVVHPQHWPAALDYAEQRVLVIGSGATAVTLVPAMARRAAHVTMLQRSPTYLWTMPSVDRLSPRLARWVSTPRARALIRRLSITAPEFIYRAARRWPATMRRLLLASVRNQLKGAAPMRHFEPDYQPWDQRLCVVSDGDLFERIRAGKVEVVTDEIERFDAAGVVLRSGRRIAADLVVLATGLKLQSLGGIAVRIDGTPYQPGEHLLYRGVLLEGLPNLAWIIGYINHAWTLKAEMAARYICRLLHHMDGHGQAVAMASDRAGRQSDGNVMSALRAGYIRRAAGELPRQGVDSPWRVTHDRRIDRQLLLREPIDDGILSFEAHRSPSPSAVAEQSDAASAGTVSR